MNTAILIFATIGFLGSVGFILVYHLRTGGQCWRNEVGVWLMVSRANLAGIFGLIISNRLFGYDWAGRAESTFVLTALFMFQTFWPSRLLWTTQWLKRRVHNTHEEDV